jgi:hypothetical protein
LSTITSHETSFQVPTRLGSTANAGLEITGSIGSRGTDCDVDRPGAAPIPRLATRFGLVPVVRLAERGFLGGFAMLSPRPRASISQGDMIG